METGRKFWITVFGMVIVGALSAVAMMTRTTPPDSMAAAIATMVLSFCGANAGATIGYAMSANKSENRTVNETVTREIKERRDDDAEDTP